ncbi:MAG: arsenate reductase [Bacteroidia bacterium]|jgi:arsenate reductase
MHYILYGIPNCDTIKKAKTWLDDNLILWSFYNYKTNDIEPQIIDNWLKQVPLNKILNKASATFRKLSDQDKVSCENPSKAIALMVQNPSMIKRPVLEINGQVVAVGFKHDNYAKVLLN